MTRRDFMKRMGIGLPAAAVVATTGGLGAMEPLTGTVKYTVAEIDGAIINVIDSIHLFEVDRNGDVYACVPEVSPLFQSDVIWRHD